MSRIMVTGINGFVGQHLAKELAEKGHQVIGSGQSGPPAENIEGHLADYFICELTDKNAVHSMPLDKVDTIINLAGLASVGPSFKNPKLYMNINTSVLSNVCQEIVNRNLHIRVLAISTGAVYDSHQPMPLTEESKTIGTGSPYAKSKLEMEAVAKKFRKEGLDCIIARPFNHIGPGQGLGFLLADLASQLVHGNHKLRAGNLNTKRDYTDVRDVVRSYELLATKQNLEYDIYNICSGKSHSGKEMFEAIKKELSLKDVELSVDEAKIRPSDAIDIYGSNKRLHQDTGWNQEITFEQTVHEYITWLKQQP